MQPYVDAVRGAVETRNAADEISKLIEDHLNSGASAVAPSPQPKDKVEQTQADIDEVVAIANKNRG